MQITINTMTRIFFLVLTFLFLSACQDAKPIVLHGKTMGTTYNIKAYPSSNKLSEEQLHQDVEKALKAVNQSMSTYIPDSEINRFNQLPSGTVMPISEDFRKVVAESIRLGESTGTLDVTMGPLIDLWGFGPDKRPTKRPEQSALNEMRSRIGVDKLILTDAGLAKSIDSLELSFSATAKGYGIDKVAEVMEHYAITNYMIEIGGELRVAGEKPSGPWVIAIEKPDAPVGERQIHRPIKPGTNGIATSGDYRIFYEMDGETFTHLIDPATGRPVKHELVSVTVLHPSAMTADGLATALTVMGTKRAKAYAQQHNLPVYLMFKTENGIDSYASDAFKPYLMTN
ncbi:FAD:protein FMN transferase [Pseudoalteromonas sp. T1lg65]|uniref:FAD:protein FMN transferase n=1 Tax=Pseudoalteromonas sp. T1lg65 TaxID=2077101 RepID=UPI003F79000E